MDQLILDNKVLKKQLENTKGELINKNDQYQGLKKQFKSQKRMADNELKKKRKDPRTYYKMA